MLAPPQVQAAARALAAAKRKLAAAHAKLVKAKGALHRHQAAAPSRPAPGPRRVRGDAFGDFLAAIHQAVVQAQAEYDRAAADTAQAQGAYDQAVAAAQAAPPPGAAPPGAPPGAASPQDAAPAPGDDGGFAPFDAGPPDASPPPDDDGSGPEVVEVLDDAGAVQGYAPVLGALPDGRLVVGGALTRRHHFGVVGCGPDGLAVVGWHVGFNLFDPSSYHEVVENPGKVLADAGQAMAHPDHMIAEAGKALAPIADMAKEFASNAIGAVSLVPGIGTGVAAALSAGMALLEGGDALDVAVKAAYGAIPIPPGIKTYTDVVIDGVLSLVHHRGDLAATGIGVVKAELLKRIPAQARDVAGSVFDTLAHLVLGAIHGQPTIALATQPIPPNALQALQAAHAATLALPPGHPAAVATRLPPHVTPLPPRAPHMLALHLAPALARAPLTPAIAALTGRQGVHASFEVHV